MRRGIKESSILIITLILVVIMGTACFAVYEMDIPKSDGNIEETYEETLFITDNALKAELIDTSFEYVKNNTLIKISGKLPLGVQLSVNEKNAVKEGKQVCKNNSIYDEFIIKKVFDISLYNEYGIKYQPKKDNTFVTITIVDPSFSSIDNKEVYRIEDAGKTVTEMYVYDYSDDAITFDTDHFTEYSVNESTNMFGNSYLASIPASIDLYKDEETGEYLATYEVGIKGNIPSNKYVYITPEDSFYLEGKTTNKRELVNISQDYQRWSQEASEDLHSLAVTDSDYVMTEGTVTTTLTQADMYSGKFRFNYGMVKFEDGEFTKLPLAKELTYNGTSPTNGEEQELVESGESNTDRIEYSFDDTNYSLAIPTGINAGTYRIYYRLTYESEYNDSNSGYVDVTIRKKNMSVTSSNGSAIYTGERTIGENNAIASVVPTDPFENATISYGLVEGEYIQDDIPSFINVGTYTVYYKISAENYNDYTGSLNITINRADGLITAPSARNLTYNNDEQELVIAGSSTTGAVQYKLDDGEWSEDIPKATDAGTYTVYYKSVGDANHNDTDEESVTVTIKNKDMTVTSHDGEEVYSGSETDGDAYVEVAEPALYTINYGTAEGEYTLDNIPKYTDVGTYTVYYKVTAEKNYNDYTGSFTITIDKAVNSLTTNVTAKTLTYNASEQILVNAGIAKFGTIKYKLDTDDENAYTTVLPKGTNADTYIVQYKVDGTNNYDELIGFVNVAIGKADNVLSLTNSAGNNYTGDNTCLSKSLSFNVSQTGDGTLSVSSGATLSGNKVTVSNPTSAQIKTITVTSGETPNYKPATATFKAEFRNHDSYGVQGGTQASVATCTTKEKIYYKCSKCNANLTTTYDGANALGHSYGTPTYTWGTDGKTCTAKRVCSRNSAHVETQNATVTSKVKTAATCTAKGTTTYTATFTNTAFATKTKDVTDIAMKSHSYATCAGTKFDFTMTKVSFINGANGFSGTTTYRWDATCLTCGTVFKGVNQTTGSNDSSNVGKVIETYANHTIKEFWNNHPTALTNTTFPSSKTKCGTSGVCTMCGKKQ